MQEKLDNNELIASIKKRPFMYFSDLAGLFEGLLLDCISICKTEAITFTISILAENKYIISIQSSKNLNDFIQQFLGDAEQLNIPYILKVISNIKINFYDRANFEFEFSFETAIIQNTKIEYYKLHEKATQIALLNQNCEIILRDESLKYLVQNYYSYPQGIFYLFDIICNDAHAKPNFNLTLNNNIGTNNYKIGIAYRTDWNREAIKISYANDIETINGGSLVEGILDGIKSGLKKYIKHYDLKNFKINNKNVKDRLILVCAVKGDEFVYSGSFKEKLDDIDVKKQSKKLISQLVFEYLHSNKELADKFLERFNDNLPNKLSKILGY